MTQPEKRLFGKIHLRINKEPPLTAVETGPYVKINTLNAGLLRYRMSILDHYISAARNGITMTSGKRNRQILIGKGIGSNRAVIPLNHNGHILRLAPEHHMPSKKMPLLSPAHIPRDQKVPQGETKLEDCPQDNHHQHDRGNRNGRDHRHNSRTQRNKPGGKANPTTLHERQLENGTTHHPPRSRGRRPAGRDRNTDPPGIGSQVFQRERRAEGQNTGALHPLVRRLPMADLGLQDWDEFKLTYAESLPVPLRRVNTTFTTRAGPTSSTP